MVVGDAHRRDPASVSRPGVGLVDGIEQTHMNRLTNSRLARSRHRRILYLAGHVDDDALARRWHRVGWPRADGERRKCGHWPRTSAGCGENGRSGVVGIVERSAAGLPARRQREGRQQRQRHKEQRPAPDMRGHRSCSLPCAIMGHNALVLLRDHPYHQRWLSSACCARLVPHSAHLLASAENIRGGGTLACS